MKILISTFTFPPNKDGVSEAAAAGARAFLERGWEVDIATEPTEPTRASSDWQGAKIHEFNISGSSYFRHPYQGQISEYQAFLQSGLWDVVIFHGYSWPLYLAAAHLSKIPGKKILVSHGYNVLTWTPVKRFPFGLVVYVNNLIQAVLMLRWVKGLDRWVFLSERKDFQSFFDHWLAARFQHPGISIIPNGVSAGISGSGSCFRNLLNIKPDTLVFLCVGYFSRAKDQGSALYAYRKASLQQSCMVFIGPRANQWMEKFKFSDPGPATQNQDSQVFWLTEKTREFTLDAFAACDVYISASFLETQPISILEAMANAKPWIARQAGCIGDLQGGICVKNRRAMAKAMRRLAADPDLRKKLGQKGQAAIAANYQRKQYEERFCRLLENVVREDSQKEACG